MYVQEWRIGFGYGATLEEAVLLGASICLNVSVFLFDWCMYESGCCFVCLYCFQRSSKLSDVCFGQFSILLVRILESCFCSL